MKLFERFKKIFNRNNNDEFINIENEDKEENTELLADEVDILWRCNSYFSFDWCTREYMEKSGEHYSYFGYRDDDGNTLTFKDFKIYAEEYTIEKYVKLPENKKWK